MPTDSPGERRVALMFLEPLGTVTALVRRHHVLCAAPSEAPAGLFDDLSRWPDVPASELRIHAEHWSNGIRQSNPPDARIQNAIVFEFPESREDCLRERPPKYATGV